MKKILISIVFFCTPLFAYTETLTTNNLITNGTFESGNSNGWTTNGDVQVLNDCCGSNYDLEFGDSGSIEQSFSLISETVTQTMLDNGNLSLNSSILIQNGECSGTGCWAGSNRGGVDPFTVRLQIKDANENVLATSTNIRTNSPTGINGEVFYDQVTYNGTGSNIGSIFISATDAAAPSVLGSTNVDNVSVTLTYDNTVLTATQTTALNETVEELNEVIELFEEIIPEEIFTEEFVIQEFEPIALEIIEENFTELTIAEQFIEEEMILSVVETEPEIVEMVEPEPVVEEITEMVEEIQTIEEELYAEVSQQEEPGITEPEEKEISEPEEEINSEEPGSEPGSEPESTGTGDEGSTQTISEETTTVPGIDDIAAKVASKIQDLDRRLEVTQMIVAKVIMGENNNAINSYAKFGNEIFENQLEIKEISLTTAYLKDLEKDDRVISSPVFYEYQEKLDKANADVIRAKEHLRNIRGY
tara:strand:- start:307 stop:1731 length:1425 start_codon:yes stop_codon:yes gene_type:complete